MRLRSKRQTHNKQTLVASRHWRKRLRKLRSDTCHLSKTKAKLVLKADTGQPPGTLDISAVGLEDFVNSGRTGRRNAMGDILDENYTKVSTTSLPFEFNKLVFEDTTEPTATTAATPEPCKDVKQNDAKPST